MVLLLVVWLLWYQYWLGRRSIKAEGLPATDILA